MKSFLKPSLITSFLLICAIFGYFSFNAPLMTDNYVFSLNISPSYSQFYTGGEITKSPLSISGVFQQACTMYSQWCGRFAGNLAVYLIFLLPSWLGHIISILGFACYIFLLQICVFGRQWRENLTASWILTLAAFVWLSIPSFGEAFFWLSVGGQIALFAQIFMLLPYRMALYPDYEPNKSISYTCILSVLFFIAGAATSSLDYPTSAALPVTTLATVVFIYFFQNKGQRKIPWILLFGAFGLLFGGILTITAPGNTQRLLLTNDQQVISWLSLSWPEKIVDWLIHLPLVFTMLPVPFLILAWGLFSLYRKHGKNFYKYIPVAALFFLLPFFLTIGAYLFTSWPPPRAFATCSIQLLLASLIISVKALPLSSSTWFLSWKFLKRVLIILCVISISWNIFIFYKLHNAISVREKIISTSQDEAILPALELRGNSFQPLGDALADLAEDPNYWVNRAMALYYDLKSVAKQNHSRVYNPLTENYSSNNINPGSIKIFLDKERFYIQTLNRGEAKLLEHGAYIYYYGRPAFLAQLWTPLADKIFIWLTKIKEGSPLINIIPMLLARADLKVLDNSNNIWAGPLIRIYNPEVVWLVKPGESKYSFDLIPLNGSEGTPDLSH